MYRETKNFLQSRRVRGALFGILCVLIEIVGGPVADSLGLLPATVHVLAGLAILGACDQVACHVMRPDGLRLIFRSAVVLPLLLCFSLATSPIFIACASIQGDGSTADKITAALCENLNLIDFAKTWIGDAIGGLTGEPLVDAAVTRESMLSAFHAARAACIKGRYLPPSVASQAERSKVEQNFTDAHFEALVNEVRRELGSRGGLLSART